jgi:hypothetical protein
MASIWKLNGIDIYVDVFGDSKDPTIAELNPINSIQSVYHWITTPDKTIEIQGTVVGTGYKQLIENTVASVVTLTTDLGDVTVLIKNIKSDRQLVSCQYVDLSQPTTSPVYRVTITMRT